MSASPEKVLLAARRGYLNPKDINGPFSQLDLYDITSKSQPKYVHTIIEYEDITGLSWLDEKHLISVSLQATINIYNIKSGTKVKSMTTDYGPITSFKHSVANNVLVTGTEYGYAAVYKIGTKDRSIECVNKMVKVTEMIAAIDFQIKPRPLPAKKLAVSKKPSDLLKHAKRKGAESSEESENDDDDDSDTEKSDGGFFEMNDLVIYGGYLDKLVAWDFHRTTILDTVVVGNKVSSIVVLRSGNIAVADVAGYLGIIDHITFTCRQSDRLFESSILTLATNYKNSTIVAAGHEPIIAILKIDKSSEAKDLYILREKLRDHSAPVASSLFTTKREFFTASDDNKVVKFRLARSDGALKMKRFNLMPTYKNKMNFHNHEAMAIFGKSFQIFKFNTDAQHTPEVPSRRSFSEPQRTCTIRASAYVHAATLDDKWFCYSTSSGVKILNRPKLDRVDTTALKLPACHIMRLCQSGRCLVIGQQKKLAIIELEDELQPNVVKSADDHKTDGSDEGVDNKPKVKEHKSIFVSKLKGVIRDMLYFESSNRLIVSCGTTSHSLYVIKMPSPNAPGGSKIDEDEVGILFKTGVPSPISHIARNIYNQDDLNLYIYTTRDQIIACDTLSKTLKKDLTKGLTQQERIRGLPKDIGIQGMVVLSSSQCLIYDSMYVFKADLGTNEIVNSTMDYARILTLDNAIFNKSHEILIVSMT